jgi:hypothetical protein
LERSIQQYQDIIQLLSFSALMELEDSFEWLFTGRQSQELRTSPSPHPYPGRLAPFVDIAREPPHPPKLSRPLDEGFRHPA